MPEIILTLAPEDVNELRELLLDRPHREGWSTRVLEQLPTIDVAPFDWQSIPEWSVKA